MLTCSRSVASITLEKCLVWEQGVYLYLPGYHKKCLTRYIDIINLFYTMIYVLLYDVIDDVMQGRSLVRLEPGPKTAMHR